MMEHRLLREIEEVSILNQRPKRVSLRGRSKACYLRWCPGSRVGATESVPVDGYQCPIYTRVSRYCLRQWAPWNLLRHQSRVMNEWGRRETERGGADRRGFSWRGLYARKEWLETCAQTVRGGDFSTHIETRGGRASGRVSRNTEGWVGWGDEARRPVIMTGLCGGAEEKSAQPVSWLALT